MKQPSERSLHPAHLALLALLGCEATEDLGSVAVGWRLAGRTCAEAGLEQVEAALFDYSGVAPRFTTTAACSAGVVTVEGVEPGRYALVLTGREADGCATHAARTDTVRVLEGETTEVPVLLLARRPRTLNVAWPFANEASCLENGVAQVTVEVRVSGLVERRVPALCGSGAVHLPDIPPGALDVRVVGYDQAGIAVATGDQITGDPLESCADEVAVEVSLDLCLEPGC